MPLFHWWRRDVLNWLRTRSSPSATPQNWNCSSEQAPPVSFQKLFSAFALPSSQTLPSKYAHHSLKVPATPRSVLLSLATLWVSAAPLLPESYSMELRLRSASTTAASLDSLFEIALQIIAQRTYASGSTLFADPRSRRVHARPIERGLCGLVNFKVEASV